MDINGISNELLKQFVIKKTDVNEWEVVMRINLPNNFIPKVFIKEIGGKWFFSDKKNTLKFMNVMYELNAQDVKNCIAGVLKNYGFAITAGEIFVQIQNGVDALNKFYQFVCCMAELVNMFVFFDKPE